MAEHMGDLAVHVPIHQLAGAQAARLCTDQQAARRQRGRRLLDDLDPSIANIAGDFHGLKTYLMPLPALRSSNVRSPSSSLRSPEISGLRSMAGSRSHS